MNPNQPRLLTKLLLANMFAMSILAEPVRLDVTRDTWVSDVGQEADFNTGGSSRLKLKGVQEFSILDIDPARLKGRLITSAELHVKNASKEILRRVTVSTLSSEWAEGTADSYVKQKGSASFNWAMQDEKPWAWPGSDLTAVCLGQGGSLWRFADATPPDKEGWQVIPVDPRIVQARIAGISSGFVLMDDVGSEYERNGERFTWKLFPNRFVYSHEQSNGRPYFVVNVGGENHAPPAAPKWVRAVRQERAGGSRVVAEHTGDGDDGTLGYLARYGEGEQANWEKGTAVPQYLLPMAGPGTNTIDLEALGGTAGQKYWIAIRAVDGAGNASEASTCVWVAQEKPRLALPPNAVTPFADEGPAPKVGGLSIAVIDALDKMNPLTGQCIPAHDAGYLRGNHLWSASRKTLRLFAGRKEFVDFQVLLSGSAKGIKANLAMPDRSATCELSRMRCVGSKAGPLPDPVVPLEGPFDLPGADEAVPDQKHVGLLGELYVSADAATGVHHGTLTLSAGGESVDIDVELHVWNFTLPNVLSFVPEMNCYGLPDGQEAAYYRMAHRHRTNLNRLGYSWRGTPNDGCAPRWNGKTFDWTDYDRRFGPLLDGSAFADLPRGGVPVDAFYLPINENWPVDINKHFKGGYWADQAFDAEYEKQFREACGQFAEHFHAKGWFFPAFEFYLNNKVYYKNDAWSKSSAPWILDEPVNTQDFWALRYYGKLFHEGVAQHGSGDPGKHAVHQVNMAFRCDISYPQWQRDMLDGILNVNICGGAFRQYHAAVMDRKERNGEITFNYGSSNNIEESNTQPAGWCLDVWCLGGDGVLPWQTVGDDKSWKQADALSLFYPAQHGGKEPVASIRLKGYRRGEQDVEYLTMLSLQGQGRPAVAAAAREALGLTASVVKKNADDAGLVAYAGLEPQKLWELRMRVGAMLDRAKPPARPAIVEQRAFSHDVSKLPAIGYVGK